MMIVCFYLYFYYETRDFACVCGYAAAGVEPRRGCGDATRFGAVVVRPECVIYASANGALCVCIQAVPDVDNISRSFTVGSHSKKYTKLQNLQ